MCAGFSEHLHLNNHFVLSPSIAVMLGIPATNYLLGIKIESFTTLEMNFIQTNSSLSVYGSLVYKVRVSKVSKKIIPFHVRLFSIGNSKPVIPGTRITARTTALGSIEGATAQKRS